MNINIDTETLTGSYYMDADGFDDYSEYENYADAFCDQANDILGEDINEELEGEGYEIDYGDHRASEFYFGRDHYGTDIYFPISKI